MHGDDVRAIGRAVDFDLAESQRFEQATGGSGIGLLGRDNKGGGLGSIYRALRDAVEVAEHVGPVDRGLIEAGLECGFLVIDDVAQGSSDRRAKARESSNCAPWDCSRVRGHRDRRRGSRRGSLVWRWPIP